MQPGTAVTRPSSVEMMDTVHTHTLEMESSIKQGTAATLHSGIAKEALSTIHTYIAHAEQSYVFHGIMGRRFRD